MKKSRVIVMILAATLSLGAADLKKGQASYDTSCKSCHGADGTPNAAFAKMLKADMRDLKSPEVQSLSVADIKKIIQEGKGKMKPVTALAAPAQDDVAAYVKSLKK